MPNPKWTDAAYAALVKKHPELESKPESVAVATWALAQDPDTSPEGFRALSKSTRVEVRGRAIGSARELLGLRKKTTAKKKGKTPGKKTATHRGAKAPRKSSGDGLGDLIAAVQGTQKARDRAVATLTKVRDMIDDTLQSL